MSQRCVLLLAVLWSQVAVAQRDYPPTLPGSTEVAYKTVDDVTLNMWLYFPKGHDPARDARPAIVFFFGGGWKQGSPQQFEGYCRYLASRGMVAATADYRVAVRHGVKADRCVEDARSAVRWLREQSQRLGVDPSRIAAAGGSAGGHTACCTALLEGFEAAGEDTSVSSVPNAMALFNPAVLLAELGDFGTGGLSDDKLADIATRTGVAASALSPIHHVRGHMPPTIIFHGKADPTVPYETVEEFSRRMAAAGNRCELHGFAEAPHGFFNLRSGTNAEINDRSSQWHQRTLFQLDTFLHSLGWLEGHPTVRIVDQDFVSFRGNLQNSFRRFAAEKTGHVAFLGGSITEMNGYRPIITAWLQKRFPETDFTFTNAGIASTCSTTGAFRVHQDVLEIGPTDLLFVEFAVNDDQDASHTAEDCIRGMEGIIRRVRRHNPNADIVMTHFVNPGMLETLSAGKTILSANSHEQVARHYEVSSVYLSKEVAARIADGRMTWQEFGGTHPGPAGNQLAADLAVSILEAGWRDLPTKEPQAVPHPTPTKPLLDSSWDSGIMLPLQSLQIVSGWSISEPDWNNIPGSKRSRFLGIPLVHADQPGASLQFNFTGTAAGAYVVAGPDAGRLDYRIDDGDWNSLELYHRFSTGLHYPRTVMFAEALPDGPHHLTVRVSESHHPDSTGTAARVVHFVVNETETDR